jgi:hypothetical protein
MAATLLSTLNSLQARAQSEMPKVELGVSLTAIDLNEVFEVPGGVGARFGYNFTKYISFDSEVNYFPRRGECRRVGSGPLSGISACFGGPTGNFGQTQAMFGVKAGYRFETVGIFAKLRPGFIHFREKHITPDFNNQSLHRFALDVGGVLEFYPARRIVLRIDLGDTIIPFGGRTINTVNGPVRLETVLHNVQGGFGVGVRF